MKESFITISDRALALKKNKIQDSTVIGWCDGDGKTSKEIRKLFHHYKVAVKYPHGDQKIFSGINGDRELLSDYAKIHSYLSKQKYVHLPDENRSRIKEIYKKHVHVHFLDFGANFFDIRAGLDLTKPHRYQSGKQVLVASLPYIGGKTMLELFEDGYMNEANYLCTKVQESLYKTLFPLLIPGREKEDAQKKLRNNIFIALANVKMTGVNTDTIYLTCTDIGGNIRDTVEVVRECIGMNILSDKNNIA